MARSADTIRIATYDRAMRPGVAALFVRGYGGRAAEWEANFGRFYDHPYQRERSIRIVALDAERVVGLQTFFYWPYRFDSEEVASFQSGSSLVDPDYRGYGVFARLLAHLDDIEARSKIDFLMGFPVEASFHSFLRNGWANPLDLAWYARIIRPLSVLSRVDRNRIDLDFDRQPEAIDSYHLQQAYTLTTDASFWEWRYQLGNEISHRYFHHKTSSGCVRFDLKLNQRGRIIELIIGRVAATTPGAALLDEGLRALVRAAVGHRHVTILTVALNRQFRGDALLPCVRRRLFFPLRPRIHFIVKDVNGRRAELMEARRWRLLRSDLDTW
jgi:GNAT superfamily N-acetyltransferase